MLDFEANTDWSKSMMSALREVQQLLSAIHEHIKWDLVAMSLCIATFHLVLIH